MDIKKLGNLVENQKMGEIVGKVGHEAERRGHAQQTAFAGAGGMFGAVLGSFFGKHGAAFGGLLGAFLGAFFGNRRDLGLPLVPDGSREVKAVA